MSGGADVRGQMFCIRWTTVRREIYRITDAASGDRRSRPVVDPRLVYCVYMHCVIRRELQPTASIPKAINL